MNRLAERRLHIAGTVPLQRGRARPRPRACLPVPVTCDTLGSPDEFARRSQSARYQRRACRGSRIVASPDPSHGTRRNVRSPPERSSVLCRTSGQAVSEIEQSLRPGEVPGFSAVSPLLTTTPLAVSPADASTWGANAGEAF